MRKFDGGRSDESRRLFTDPNEDVRDAIEDVHVFRIQHSLRQLVVRDVNLRELQVSLAEANLMAGYRRKKAM